MLIVDPSARTRLRRDVQLLDSSTATARQVLRTLELWLRRGRSRRELAARDDRMLRDIGLTRAQAERESVIPFWR